MQKKQWLLKQLQSQQQKLWPNQWLSHRVILLLS